MHIIFGTTVLQSQRDRRHFRYRIELIDAACTAVKTVFTAAGLMLAMRTRMGGAAFPRMHTAALRTRIRDGYECVTAVNTDMAVDSGYRNRKPHCQKHSNQPYDYLLSHPAAKIIKIFHYICSLHAYQAPLIRYKLLAMPPVHTTQAGSGTIMNINRLDYN